MESPAPIEVPVAARRLIIEVSNNSDRDAVLLVASDEGTNFPNVRKVGTARPPLVPPHATINVVFTVPQTGNWAIFVNPSPDYGPLLMGMEFGTCAGLVPIGIRVNADGAPGWSSKNRDAPACMVN
jgi:hypothetical protein